MEITVIKQDSTGREVWRYTGRLIRQRADRIVIEAFFDRPDKTIHGLVLEKGDRFVETYFSLRWYNIYKIYSQANGALKGWYCDICFFDQSPEARYGHPVYSQSKIDHQQPPGSSHW